MSKRFYIAGGKEVLGLKEARKLRALPSVTTVIDTCAPHEYKWMDYKRLTEALESDATVEEKLDVLGNQAVFETGSIVHAVSEAYSDFGIKSDPFNLPNSTKQMYAELDRIKDKKTEIFLFAPEMGTGGRIDILGKDGVLMIADLKTCTNIVQKVKPIWQVQLGAYYGLCLENDIHPKKAKIIQYSKKNMGCHSISLNQEELNIGLENFNRLREVFRFWYGI